MWAAARRRWRWRFPLRCRTNNKNYFLSPELAKAASGSTLDIFYYLLGLFLYSLRASVWVRVIKNSSPTCMMNKAASQRENAGGKEFPWWLCSKESEQRRMPRRKAGCCAAQISAKLQNQSLFARLASRTCLLLGKLDFVINWCPRHKVFWIINQLLLSPSVKIHISFF